MRSELVAVLPEPKGDPELQLLKREHVTHFKASFAEAVAALDSADRLLLKQHLVERLTIDQLGALYHLHRASAARSPLPTGFPRFRAQAAPRISGVVERCRGLFHRACTWPRDLSGGFPRPSRSFPTPDPQECNRICTRQPLTRSSLADRPGHDLFICWPRPIDFLFATP